MMWKVMACGQTVLTFISRLLVMSRLVFIFFASFLIFAGCCPHDDCRLQSKTSRGWTAELFSISSRASVNGGVTHGGVISRTGG